MPVRVYNISYGFDHHLKLLWFLLGLVIEMDWLPLDTLLDFQRGVGHAYISHVTQSIILVYYNNHLKITYSLKWSVKKLDMDPSYGVTVLYKTNFISNIYN